MNTLPILLSQREAYFFNSSVISGPMTCFPNRIWQKWCYVQSRAWASTGLMLLPLLSGYASWWELGKEAGRSRTWRIRVQNRQPAPTFRKVSKVILCLTAQKTLQMDAAVWMSQAKQQRKCPHPKYYEKQYIVTIVSQLVLELFCYAAIANKYA